MSRDNPLPCPVCHRRWRYLAAHLWVAHGERVLGWLV